MKQNREPEIDPHLHSHLTFNKGTKQWVKESCVVAIVFQTGAGITKCS